MADSDLDPGASGDETVPGDSVVGPATGQAPTRIGRHVVIEEIGSGGMGVVYAAYDPELDRKIAVKLVRASRRGDSARAQLLREAKAMARLSHPNVIQVYDVGVQDGQVFIAMEYIEGQSLRAWLDAHPDPPPWREVRDLFVRIGRGLAAAHAAGLVHRDFKPDNVMIAADGRPRILDFGLVHSSNPQTADSLAVVAEAAMTHSGKRAPPRLAGTPAYMSAEQIQGEDVVPRTDQFAFCVALHEGLYGRRPFIADNLTALAIAVMEDRVTAPPPGSDVPGWLRRAVVRGLRSNLEERHASMEDLLHELSRDPGRRVRRWASTAAVAAGVGLAAWQLSSATSAEGPACDGAADRLVGVWDAGRRAAAREAMLGSGTPYADDAWTHASRRIDAYTEAWVAQHGEACRATHVRGEQSGALLDLRMACLEDGLTHVKVLTDALAAADEAVVARAAVAAASLPELSRCQDVDALTAPVEPPAAEVESDVARLRSRLSRARAFRVTGQYDRGLELARAALEAAERLEYAPLIAEAKYAAGDLEDLSGHPAEAEALLTTAYWLALESKHDQVLAQAATQLVYVVGLSAARPDDGLAWGLHAAAAQRRVKADAAARADLANGLGAAYLRKGDYERATIEYTRALELRSEAHGREDDRVAAILNNLGVAHRRLGRTDEAREAHAEALEIRQRVLGPRHPRIAAALNNLSVVEWRIGNLDAARKLSERALQIRIDAFGAKHPKITPTLVNLGLILKDQGHLPGARERMERALEIEREALGPEHPDLATTLTNLGEVYLEEGSVPAAREAFRSGLAIKERAYGSEHPELVPLLIGAGRAALAAGERKPGLRDLERAVTIGQAVELEPETLADAKFALAEALDSTGHDPARARTLMAEVRDQETISEAGRTRAREWLARRGG